MISTKRDGDDVKFSDSSADFKDAYGEWMYKLVMAALAAGLEEFTTPTPADGEGREAWKTRKWVTLQGGKLKVFLVAYPERNAECEILGPEVKQGK